jgi:hypothetical protein
MDPQAADIGCAHFAEGNFQRLHRHDSARGCAGPLKAQGGTGLGYYAHHRMASTAQKFLFDN